MRKGIANDPLRKEKIAQTALDLLGEGGMRAVTHRTIAARAGIPLGSLTYHYGGLDDIFVAAFELLARDMDPRYNQAIIDAHTPGEACEVLVDAICGSRRATERELRLYRELFAYGTTSLPVQRWIRAAEQRSIDALTTHFPEPAARALDALVDGWWTYQSWNPDASIDRDMVAAAVAALAGISTDPAVLTQPSAGHRRKQDSTWPTR